MSRTQTHRSARVALFALACAAAVASAPLTAQSDTRAITGITLIDGTTRAPIPNATLLVRAGKVVAAGAASSVTIPAGAERVAMNGKFVIPGLINTHGHVNGVPDLSTYAAYGITTIYSLGGEPADVFAARAQQDSPTLSRARVYVAGPVLTPGNPAEARTQVADNAAQKPDIIKIRVDDMLGTARKITPESYRAVITEAHNRGFRVAAHIYGLEDAKDVLNSGADFIAHSVRDLPVDAAFIQAMKSKGVCYTPTLMREVSTFVYESTPPFFSDSLFKLHANKQWIAQLSEPARQDAMRANAAAQKYKAQLPLATRNMKALFDAGIPVVMGTDTGPVGRFQGYFELMEMEMMAAAGMTPAQVLASATREAARCTKLDGELGTLESGKRADFVVLDASPLDNISNLRRINSVWIAGNRIQR
ncbi:MAG: amidohydrolase family protein [Gemmatimonas sp.]